MHLYKHFSQTVTSINTLYLLHTRTCTHYLLALPCSPHRQDHIALAKEKNKCRIDIVYLPFRNVLLYPTFLNLFGSLFLFRVKKKRRGGGRRAGGRVSWLISIGAQNSSLTEWLLKVQNGSA